MPPLGVEVRGLLARTKTIIAGVYKWACRHARLYRSRRNLNRLSFMAINTIVVTLFFGALGRHEITDQNPLFINKDPPFLDRAEDGHHRLELGIEQQVSREPRASETPLLWRPERGRRGGLGGVILR